MYQFTDTPSMRMLEDRWSYTSSTIFVPVSLLPVEVPDDHESPQGEFSVFIENAYDIEAFYAAAEPLAQEMDVALRFSDGGWLSVRDSFGAGARTMLLTTILYLAGAVLALLMAVYLYISRNKKVYAIMRSQGVPVAKACCTIALPLGVLAVPAINVMMLINGQELNYSITVTNNLERYLSEDYTVTYVKGYDDTLFTGNGQVCLLGQKAAEIFGVRPGDEISVLPYDLYLVLTRTNDNADTLQAAVEQATSMYEVAGIIHSDQESISNGIFAAVNSEAEAAYGQPFPIEYSEFTLSDNEKLDELSDLLNDQKVSDKKDAPMASFYLNSAGLENIRRVRDLLNLLFPVAVTAAILIGVLGPGLLIMQSAREAAYLRILGVTKKRVRCMLVLEQIVLCAVGITVVSGGLALYDHERLIRSAGTLAVCGVLYLLGCVCGALGASILVTRRRALELLQVKE